MEKEQWTDKVFTGDNVEVTAKLSKDAAERDERIHKKGKAVIKDTEKAVKNKFTQLAQLLMQESKQSKLGGVVDEASIRQFRQALRRKYAARSNLERIW